MPIEYQTVEECLAYVSKSDKTNTNPRFLVPSSQNVLINDQEKVQTRAGYTIYGAAGSGSDPIEAACDWSHSKNAVINLRAYGSTLQAYLGKIDGVAVNAWTNVGEGITFSAVDFSFAPWWDTSEDLDILLFVNGADKIYDWSGGVTTLSSATSNTITKNGTETWAQARFLTSGTRKVYIGGTAYTYTGGEGTTTLTGVTPDPSGESANAVVYQAMRTNDDEPVDGWVNDFIWVDKNQLHIGSHSFNEIYISKDTDFKDFAFSSPRTPGEGALLSLDSVARGFLPLQNKMLISAGKDDWYYTNYHQLEVGTTLNETLEVKKLKTSPGMAARSQDFISGEYFVSFEPKLRRIIGIDENDNLVTEDLSDPIQPDFDAADFDNGCLKRHKNRAYVACPDDSTVFIHERKQKMDDRTGQMIWVDFWQPPQVLPIRRFAIISDLLYGHSSGFNETYKLFDGTNDNDVPISFNATFSYRSYGDRANLKKFTKWLTEGYIRGNTKITHQLRYDFQGATQTLEKEIDGSDEDIIFETVEGLTPLGTTPLGLQEESAQQPKFKIIETFAPRSFFEIQSIYYSSALDDQWELLCQGGNVMFSPNKPSKITK